VLRPLGYKVLQVQGLNPDTVSPAAARAALEAELTPQQQAVVDAEAERLFKEVGSTRVQCRRGAGSLGSPWGLDMGSVRSSTGSAVGSCHHNCRRLTALASICSTPAA
jgi:hypothetical protein